MIRAHAQVIGAALLFKLAGQRAIVLGTTVAPPSPNGDYEIGLEQLASMKNDHNITTLQQYGGVKGLAEMIKTDVETGIYGDENELSRRKNAFGSNTYPVKKGRSFLRFLWEAWQDLTHYFNNSRCGLFGSRNKNRGPGGRMVRRRKHHLCCSTGYFCYMLENSDWLFITLREK
ncbi:hypothetical protein ABFX02_10G020800 [Erythranthe guttata]